MNSHDAVVHLAAVAVVLSPNSHRLGAALGRARLVHDADGLGMSMVSGDDLLTAVAQLFLIPLDRFEKTL
jgi:hypothetical protein